MKYKPAVEITAEEAVDTVLQNHYEDIRKELIMTSLRSRYV